MSELNGKVALVTGASRNIGRAIALALAEGGAAVAVNARTSAAEAESVARAIAAAGGKAAVVLGDITNENDVKRMMKETAEAFGGIDILVNNAAIRHEAALEKLDYAHWRHTLAVILDGAYLCARAALPHLRKSKDGAIVNISGMTGQTGAKLRTHIASAKAGLEGMTRALALELAADGITVNCVSPGLVDTVRNAASVSTTPQHHEGRSFPLGRRVTPAEVAAMVRYLCGPQARLITGQVIHVNGGAHFGG
jgi:3-oxoacyl-[acyl-carrier protein] reductase